MTQGGAASWLGKKFNLAVLILDFDGVIAESVGIKTQTFRALFSEYRDQVDEIIDFHLNNDGLSRYRKFDHIYENILKMPLDEGLSKKLGARFSELALEEIKRCPSVPGAIELLENYDRKVPIFIASGTPEPELRDIVRIRGLQKYFTGVFGSPTSKSEITNRILMEGGYAPGDCLFIGDTMTDYTEATKAGVRFIGRWDGKLPPRNPFANLEIPVVGDLVGLASLLEGDTVDMQPKKLI